MGKQSVYLSQDMEGRWKALSVPLGEVLRAGLEALEDRKAAPRSRIVTPGCSHPKARVHKGLCGACGSHVGT